MLLTKIQLINFRNFSEKEFIFNPLLTIIFGENARGKTNLLESIFLLINGEGFRETKEQELIRFHEVSSRVVGQFGDNDNHFTFQVYLKKSNESVSKVFSINKTKRKFQQYKNDTPKAVLFSPEQINILTGTPESRRKYFDKQLSTFDDDYKKKLVNYDNALRKRNKILEYYKDEEQLYLELKFWNDYLIEQAKYLVSQRQKYINFLNFNKKVDSKEFSIEYVKNEVSEQRFKDFFEAEKNYKKTLIGPQKDDYAIFIKNKNSKKNLHFFGSRSEQRLSIFWLKLNEIKYIENNLKTKPILLLDDIFSELDLKNKKLVIDLIKKYQTIITTTDFELLSMTDTQKNVVKL